MAAQGAFHPSSLVIQGNTGFEYTDWQSIDEGIATDPRLRPKVIDAQGQVWDIHHIDHSQVLYWIYGGDHNLPDGSKMVAQTDVQPFTPKLVTVLSTFQANFIERDTTPQQQRWREHLDTAEGRQQTKIQHLMKVGVDLVEHGKRHLVMQKALANLWTDLKVTAPSTITWKQKNRLRVQLASLLKDCECMDQAVRAALANDAALAILTGHHMRWTLVHCVHATTLFEFTMLCRMTETQTWQKVDWDNSRRASEVNAV